MLWAGRYQSHCDQAVLTSGCMQCPYDLWVNNTCRNRYQWLVSCRMIAWNPHVKLSVSLADRWVCNIYFEVHYAVLHAEYWLEPKTEMCDTRCDPVWRVVFEVLAFGGQVTRWGGRGWSRLSHHHTLRFVIQFQTEIAKELRLMIWHRLTSWNDALKAFPRLVSMPG